jgi:hypothetical protein
VRKEEGKNASTDEHKSQRKNMIVCNPCDEIDYCTACECGVEGYFM